ncbi:MAG: hypothetical protein DRI73_06590 [Bacteroidetes bacterium]|nr:MAG: hypothetical protein DRI73_06590 [Bacteroidota bacterium]
MLFINKKLKTMTCFILKFLNSGSLPKVVILSMFFLIHFTAYSVPNEPEKTGTDWKFYSQRAEVAPAHWIDMKLQYKGNPSLAISGDGKDYTNGSWVSIVDVISGKNYKFNCFFKQKNVDEQNRSILAYIIWQGKDGKRINQSEYPPTLRELSEDGWNIIQQIYTAPEKAVTAKIELIYRWDKDGSVYFNNISLLEAPQLGSRFVNLATIHHRPKNSGSTEDNLNQFAELLSVAANKKADIVCLPEAITLVGTDKSYIEVSETVPGPTTDFLGKIAKENNMYIVAGILERDGHAVYNTAILLDRGGKLAGKYRKVALPREEIEGGVAPGSSIPVFDTDFGRIGIMICWDVFFPEVARMLAVQGAEVVFLPIWGGNLTLAKARAIENQVYLVSSTYDMKTGVFNPEGELIKEGTDEEPVVVTRIDLAKHKIWPWLGDFKNRIPREIPSSKLVKYYWK